MFIFFFFCEGGKSPAGSGNVQWTECKRNSVNKHTQDVWKVQREQFTRVNTKFNKNTQIKEMQQDQELTAQIKVCKN